MRKNGIDPKQLYPSRKMLWSAVDASPARRKLLTDVWGVPFRNQYGSGDQFWMTGECPHDYRDNHAPDDYFIFEVLDPATQEPVPPGETGMLHITNLWCRSCPYIRYNMEDMVTATTEPCTCGRTSTRLRIRGRLAWSVRVGDQYVFTQEVEDVLWASPNMAGSNYQLVRRRSQPQDRLIVRVVPNEAARAPSLEKQLQEALTRQFGVPSEVNFVTSAEITTKGIKMQRVLDVD
jgi:phenylacetate-CoA ligase